VASGEWRVLTQDARRSFFLSFFFEDKQRLSAAAALRPWEWAWAGVGNREWGGGCGGCVWVCVCVCPCHRPSQRSGPTDRAHPSPHAPRFRGLPVENVRREAQGAPKPYRTGPHQPPPYQRRIGVHPPECLQPRRRQRWFSSERIRRLGLPPRVDRLE
jgi:hypothetical protein